MRRAVVGLILLVLVLGAVAVAIDRVALARAEHEVVEQVAAAPGLTVTADARVTIAGFPFLTQVWSGRLADVALEADGVTVDALDLADVTATARGVTTAEPLTADRLEVAATVPTATLTAAVDRTPLGDLGFDVAIVIEDGRLVAETDLLGLPVRIGMIPEPAGREIAVGLETFAIAGLTVSSTDLPRTLRDALADVTVPLDELPAGLAATGVAVVADGLRITLAGNDVSLEDLAP